MQKYDTDSVCTQKGNPFPDSLLLFHSVLSFVFLDLHALFVEAAAHAAVLLHVIEGCVRAAEQLLGIRFPVANGNTHAHADRGRAVGVVHQGGVDLVHLAPDQFLRFILQVHHEDRELVPADAADIVHRAEVFRQHPADLLQGFVARLMAGGVVDLLKEVHVQDHQGRGGKIQAFPDQVIARPVIHTRQFVMGGLEAQALNVLFIGVVHLVVGVRQVPEFLGASDRQLFILADVVHGLQ